MISFGIKTWSCPCGYKQDFEPTSELQDKHFTQDKRFRGSVGVNECPACLLIGTHGVLYRVLDDDEKVKMTVYESEEDRIIRKSEMMFEPKFKYHIGYETRLETDEEYDKRIDEMDIPETAKARFKVKKSKEQRKFPVYEEETDEEKESRIDELVLRMKLATKEEVQILREKYEDKG